MLNQKTRMALSTPNKERRREIAEENGVIDEVLNNWNGGKICGQCTHFVQLGGRGSGLAGMCRIVHKRGYTGVEETCEKFERVQ